MYGTVWLDKQAVTNIPVALLAGKGSREMMAEIIDSDRICCLEAHIEVPKYCGEVFSYSVDRIVSFNGTTGLQLATNDAHTESKEIPAKSTVKRVARTRNIRAAMSWYKRAIAIYIRTMRIGLEHAHEIMKNRTTSRDLSPISLCCQHLLPGDKNAQLIASPIPQEDHVWQSGLRVSQGELFRLVSPTKEIFSELSDLLWFVDILPQHCLVKVSCALVHNTSVDIGDSDEALYTLYFACKSNDNLKEEISKVLLGFWHKGESKTLVTIMKDLQAGGKNFTLLDHEKLCKHGKLPQLWSAFSVLVRSLLLPMADENVIHLDIRSNEKHTYNILVDENSTHDGDHEDAIVLRLIDFESLVFRGSLSGTKQDHAIYWDNIEKRGAGDIWNSAHRYLLWQLLWIAYTWHPPSPSVSKETLRKEMNASTFVSFLFNDKYYLDFKSWLGIETVETLKLTFLSEAITAETIEETLAMLQIAFCNKANA
jgi:hypothetical protein